ncbi:Acyl-CoA synthetase (AMP-forming)/AMP-acid ligase II [Rhodococcus rhodochrous J3]|uniref:Acyl-CoA synthetase (AMP-forming)/AMP-acid ligase II n=1 Tax=Rhodococcus rhodochrous J3 TaxID=903528 RepID=A0ABY1MF80_RHORH|nr:fatty acid--CoA ligase family protein [Rhodococcus rhodochrous]MBF4480289.1 long-chain fatty acid--CoA ligase [Rhodococcus rhodochrous]SMG52896.1 Acyl-CoA synthetase (AMP-forming)/AMP-acid ligase II [Rhodococcus rhodochrous J3]
MNLTMLLDMAADGLEDRIVVGRRGGGISARRLRDLSVAGAAVIREAGADALVYRAVNGPAFPVALFAAARAGVPLVPINYRLGAEQGAALLSHHPDALVIADDAGDAPGVLSPVTWLDRLGRSEAVEADDPDPDAPAVVIYTSGTTSAPKGVLLHHHNLVSYVLGSVEFASAEGTDAALVSVPPYHIAAVANVLTNLYAGRRTVVLEQFTAAEWLDTVRGEGITNALVVPTMLARILDSGADTSVPTLRSLASGGAPMPRRVVERALETWPQVDFVNAYGLTETSSTITVLGPDDHRAAMTGTDERIRARLGSVGRPVPGIDLEIRDADDRVVEAGVPGRIWVRGEQVSAEYAGIGKLVDDRGFFDTRDTGFVDEDGYLFIGGRSDDTIIRGAENIAPAEIEDVILRHPAVTDTAVVGVPDDEWGQRIEAVVVLRPDESVDAEELRAFVRETLRGSKTPDRIVYWDELPRTETGKLVRRHVVERLVGDGVSGRA